MKKEPGAFEDLYRAGSRVREAVEEFENNWRVGRIPKSTPEVLEEVNHYSRNVYGTLSEIQDNSYQTDQVTDPLARAQAHFREWKENGGTRNTNLDEFLKGLQAFQRSQEELKQLAWVERNREEAP